VRPAPTPGEARDSDVPGGYKHCRVDASIGNHAAERPAGSSRGPPRWRRWRPRPGAPARIAGIYAALGLAWIGFSDRLVSALVADPATQARLQTVKGTFFVLATAAVLFLLVRASERGVQALGAEVRATVDSMADGVLLVDERLRIVEANRAAVTLLGAASAAQVLGPLDDWSGRFQLRSPDGALIPPDRAAVARVLAGEAIAKYDAILRRLDGRDVFVSVAASRVVRPDRPPLAVAVLRDVSAARRLDDMREEFLATAAHEFKTPLAVIKAYAQLMSRREPAERRALDVIQRQVDRLNRLVQHLLDTSRLRVGGGAGRRERFDLGALAREVVDRMQASAPRHQLEVQAGEAVPVVADRERIEQVIAALVDNAVRFSPGGGPVRTVVAASGSEAEVSVADHGVGIPPDRQDHVFERYYRAHAGTSHDYGGLGLGLQMSRELVEREGGRMWFESAPGAGSTFHFGLPLPAEGS
jgi:two-component system phosphate regulon sensor histidine kinase PhoR